MQEPGKSGLQQKNSRIFVDIYKKMRIISNCMDTQKDTPQEMSRAALMAACKGRKMIAGARQLKKALASGKVQAVFLALDADPGMTEPIAALCQVNQAEVFWVRSMADLGCACGIDVGAAAAAALK